MGCCASAQAVAVAKEDAPVPQPEIQKKQEKPAAVGADSGNQKVVSSDVNKSMISGEDKEEKKEDGNGGSDEKKSDPNEGRKFVVDVNALYEIKKKLGTGGYGSVLMVLDHVTHATLAMKMMNRKRNDQDYGDRFWIEADTLKLVHHPSILKFYDAFYDDKYYYLVTELLSGGELLDFILKTERFSERNASQILHSMLEAVQYLHDNEMCHLDLKPENFVFSATEEEVRTTPGRTRVLKLIDFGCARKVGDNEISNVRTGTPYYIAPEMLSRKIDKTGKVLRACDMWSMGVIAFILVTGRLPFFGETRKDILQSVVNGKYEYPADLELSDSVKDLIAKLLNKSTSERFTVAQALAHPWLSDINGVSEEPLGPTVIEGIRSCAQDSSLKKCLASLLVNDLTDEDKVNLRKMFANHDVDKNGVLQYAEVVTMVERFGYDKGEANKVAKALVQEFDMDKNGVIDLNEFAAIGTRGMLSINDQFVNQLFDYLDRDGNGFVSKEEIELYFAEQPNFKMEMDVMSIIDESDLNKDGVISRREFLAAMKGKQSTSTHQIPKT